MDPSNALGREASRVIREARASGLTFLDARRLLNLKRIALALDDVPGAFVECGVARGGCLALMAVLGRGERTVWGFDSFEALPELTPEDENSGLEWVGVRCSGPQGEHAVTETFSALRVPMDRVRVAKGWFEETVPGLVGEIGPIAILRLDADWYQATRFLLDALYDAVAPGGVVLIDDYFTFSGCRRAVDEFRARRGIDAALRMTGPETEGYWFKEPGVR